MLGLTLGGARLPVRAVFWRPAGEYIAQMEYGAHLPLADPIGRAGLTSYARTRRSWASTPWQPTTTWSSGGPGSTGSSRWPASSRRAATWTWRRRSRCRWCGAGRAGQGRGRARHRVGRPAGARRRAGSSRADYALAGVDVRGAVAAVRGGGPGAARHSASGAEPAAALPGAEPASPPCAPGGPPVWIASWGSPAGLRRVARLGDGWLASAYNTTPEQVAAGRARSPAGPSGATCAVATMWTWVTDDERERARGSAGWRRCSTGRRRSWPGAARRFARALRRAARQRTPPPGVDQVLVWPVADEPSDSSSGSCGTSCPSSVRQRTGDSRRIAAIACTGGDAGSRDGGRRRSGVPARARGPAPRRPAAVLGGEAGHHRHPEAGRHEGVHGPVVVGREQRPRLEAGGPAGVQQDAEPGAAGSAAHPGLVGEVGQPQPDSAGGPAGDPRAAAPGRGRRTAGSASSRPGTAGRAGARRPPRGRARPAPAAAPGPACGRRRW